MERSTVLIVEDDNKLRNTVSDYLSMSGFETVCCPDSKSALISFKELSGKIDVILLDGRLPDIDGFEVLQIIRRESNVPIIIISARESEEDQLFGLKNGAEFIFDFKTDREE